MPGSSTKKAEQKTVIATDDDIDVSAIRRHYETVLYPNSDTETHLLGRNEKYDTLIYLLYSHTTQFSQKYQNSRFIHLGLYKKYYANVYHKCKQLSVTFKELIILYTSLYMMIELLVTNDRQFAIYSKLLENYCNKYKLDSIPEKIASSFQDAYVILSKYAINGFEEQMLDHMCGNIEYDVLEQIQVLIEQGIFLGLYKIARYSYAKSIYYFIDSLCIHYKNITISWDAIENITLNADCTPMMYVMQTHPVVVALFDFTASLLHIVRVTGAEYKSHCIMTFSTSYFEIGERSITVLEEGQIRQYFYQLSSKVTDRNPSQYGDDSTNNLLMSQITNQNFFDLKLAFTLDLDHGEHKFAMQYSHHKLIVANAGLLQLQFLRRVDNQSQKDLIVRQIQTVPMLEGFYLTSIVGIEIINEYIVVVLASGSDGYYLIFFHINDIIYEYKLTILYKFEYQYGYFEYMGYFQMENNYYLILANRQAISASLVGFDERSSIQLAQVMKVKTPNKLKQCTHMALYRQDVRVCCCNYGLRCFADGYNRIEEMCPYCGAECGINNMYVNEKNGVRVMLSTK